MVRKSDRKTVLGLYLGPILALIILIFFDLDPQNPAVERTAAVAILMAVWWITEAVPLAVTALIPLVLFPILGIMSGSAIAPTYINDTIFLFIGGFMVALTMQKWNLHRRIALKIILLIGVSHGRIILGFMVATAFLSMWISNTATAMMMIPIAIAVVDKLEENQGEAKIRRFAVGLMIGIAYAASIGGIGTLIGTPPNLAFVRILKITFPGAPDIGFTQWIMFGFPFASVFLLIAWRLLIWLFVPKGTAPQINKDIFRDEYRRLGSMNFEERAVLIAFLILALAWIFRSDIPIGGFVIPGWTRIMPEKSFISDGTVAMAVALSLFLIPSRSENKGRLLDWATAVKIPWGIVLLFGGGFALAAGFKESGLSVWLGGHLSGFSHFPAWMIVAAVCLMMTFLTELTSNTATTQMVLPILASLAVAIRVNPLLLMIPATLSASCAFMLPVATPPNAIVFGSGRVTVRQMAQSGIILNIIGVILVTGFVFLLGRFVFGFVPDALPIWAEG
nr:SLC13/DASS family transporter [candidate division Zixibacteria bacterium]